MLKNGVGAMSQRKNTLRTGETKLEKGAPPKIIFCVFYASSSELQCSGSKHKMGQFFWKEKSACEENTKNSGPKTTGLAKDVEM